MRVHDKGSTENGIGDRVQASSSEGSDGQGDESNGDEALEGPVVRTVGRVSLGDLSGVVDCIDTCISICLCVPFLFQSSIIPSSRSNRAGARVDLREFTWAS
jgi:hypothetical protein